MVPFKVFFIFVIFALLSGCNAVISESSFQGQIIEITLPDILLEDFSFLPTEGGYRFSYKLSDGVVHEEVGKVTDPLDTDPGKAGARQNARVKNRKLSPKSLQSLAG